MSGETTKGVTRLRSGGRCCPTESDISSTTAVIFRHGQRASSMITGCSEFMSWVGLIHQKSCTSKIMVNY